MAEMLHIPCTYNSTFINYQQCVRSNCMLLLLHGLLDWTAFPSIIPRQYYFKQYRFLKAKYLPTSM